MNSILKLIYNIGGDINPLKRELARVPQEAKEAGKKAGAELNRGMAEAQKGGAGGKPGESGVAKEIGGQLKGLVMSYIGIGAVVGKVTSEAQKAKEILIGSLQNNLSVEAWQEYQIAIKETGKTLEELQELSRTLPKEFEAMMSSIRSSGKILPEDAVKQLAEVNEQIAHASSLFAKGFAGAWKAGRQEVNLFTGAIEAATGAIKEFLGWSLQMPITEREGKAQYERGKKRTLDFRKLPSDQPAKTPVTEFVSAARDAESFLQWWEDMGGPTDESARKRKEEFDKWWSDVGGDEASKSKSKFKPRLMDPLGRTNYAFSAPSLLNPHTAAGRNEQLKRQSQAEAEMRRLRKVVEQKL